MRQRAESIFVNFTFLLAHLAESRTKDHCTPTIDFGLLVRDQKIQKAKIPPLSGGIFAFAGPLNQLLRQA